MLIFVLILGTLGRPKRNLYSAECEWKEAPVILSMRMAQESGFIE